MSHLYEYSKFNASPKITRISSLVQLHGPDFLQIHRLILHSCGLSKIGQQDLNGFQNLAYLNLSGNQIVQIEGLNHLESTLVHLDLSCNHITRISSTCFQNLFNLKKLILAFNSISSLETMSQMHGTQYKLEYLDLRDNQIKDLKNIQYLKGIINLKTLLFQNADKTAQNPVCANFQQLIRRHNARGPPVNWRVYVQGVLPMLQCLDQIQLANVSVDANAQNDRDLMGQYPELRELLEEDDDEEEEDGDDLDQLLRDDEEYERGRREGRDVSAAVPAFGGDTSVVQHSPRGIQNVPPPVPAISASPLLPPRAPPHTHQPELQKSQVFNNQFQKLGSFINRHQRRAPQKRPHDSAGRRQNRGTTTTTTDRAPPTDDSLRELEDTYADEYSYDESYHSDAHDQPSPPPSPPRRQNRKRKSFQYSPPSPRDDNSSEHNLSELETSPSSRSLIASQNLRSLPSVLSFATGPPQPAGPVEETFPNEEREKLIAKIAELSETLGTTNAYIQHRESELAQEMQRRRQMENKHSQQRQKMLSYKEKTKSCLRAIKQLKEHICSLQNYQQQLEGTIKVTTEEQEQLRQNNEHLNAQLAELNNRVAKYEKDLSSQKRDEDRTSTLQTTLQQREATIENHTKQIQELTLLNDSLHNNMDQLKKEVLAHKYKLKKQEERHKRSLEQQSKLIDQQILSRQEDQQVELQRMKDHYEHELIVLQKRHDGEKNTLRENLQREHQRTMDTVTSDHATTIAQLRDELEQLHTKEVTPRDDTIRSLQREKDRLTNDLSDAESTIEDHTKQIQELKDYLKRYVNQEIHSRATEDSLKEIIETQKDKLRELAARVKQTQADSNKRELTLQGEVQTWQQKYETDIVALQSKLKMLSINSNTKDKVIQKLERRLEQYTDNTDAVESKYKTQLEEQQGTIANLQQDLKRLQNENDIKKHLIDDKEDSIQSLKSEIEQLKKDNEKLESEVDYLDDKVERLRDAEALAHDEASKKSKQIEELQLEQEEMSRLLSKETQKRQRTAQQLESLTQNIAQLKEEVERLTQSNHQLDERCHTQDNTIHELQHTVQRRTEQLRKLQEEDIVQYKQEIVNQQAQLKFLVSKIEKDREEREALKTKLQKVRRAFEENVLGD